MPLASLPSDDEAERAGFRGPECRRRRQVLSETLQALETGAYPNGYHHLAAANLQRWAGHSKAGVSAPWVRVVPGDWGQVALEATRSFGTCFAVLNMANAFVPGGAYGEGAAAQEENMFRRTDCHFSLTDEELSQSGRRYQSWMTRLVSGIDGRVYLDTERPRVCLRGPEDQDAHDLGYPWLSEEDIFPFYELRASAQDLRDGSKFDRADAQTRIAAILDTLISTRVRHAVLSAFGCGAFRNPAADVAQIFREALLSRADAFDSVVFAIRSAGYGPDNFTPFSEAMKDLE